MAIKDKLMEIVTDAVNSAMIDYDTDCKPAIDDYAASEATDYITEILTSLFKNI